jgi:hypothetical protein
MTGKINGAYKKVGFEAYLSQAIDLEVAEKKLSIQIVGELISKPWIDAGGRRVVGVIDRTSIDSLLENGKVHKNLNYYFSNIEIVDYSKVRKYLF